MESTADSGEITVSGALELPSGEPATGGMVVVFTDDTNAEFGPVDDDGEFAVTLPEREEEYEIQYYHDSNFDFPRDGVVDIYAIDSVPGDDDKTLGTTQLPVGHLVEIIVVDEDGDPVADARVGHGHINEEANASAGHEFTPLTGENGIVNLSEEPGLELNGTVEVYIEPPEDDPRFVDRAYTTTLDVTENTTSVVELEQKDFVGLIDVEPAEPGLNEEVTFNASASVGNISSYEWDFGDGNTTTGEVVTHSFDAIDTYDVTLTVTDENSETATATESVTVGGHIPIEHSDATSWATDPHQSEILGVQTVESQDSFEFGGESTTAFWITNTDTGESVTVTAPEDTELISTNRVSFVLHESNGEIRPEGERIILADRGHHPVHVEGDLEMFENENTFSNYEVSLVDTESDEPITISTTGERLTGIGYEIGFDQNSTDGDVEVTIPRDNDVDEAWDATFMLRGADDPAPVLEQSVPNDPDAENFVFTVDVSGLEDDEFTWLLSFEKAGQEPVVQELHRPHEFIVGDGSSDVTPQIAVDPAEPDLNEEVTFNASASMGNISSYEWDFGDGNTTTGSEVVTHSFDEIDTYEVTLTVTDEHGETATATESVSVGGHVPIKHWSGTSTSSDNVFADALSIRHADDEITLDIGGDSNTAFLITNTETGKTLTVTPEGEDTVSGFGVSFHLHDETGTIYPDAHHFIGINDREGAETMEVDLEGDLDIFESNDTFSTYEVVMIDTEHDLPIETAGERLMGIGYEADLTQNSTDGEIEVMIPRDADIDENWDVRFELRDGNHWERILEQPLENNADAEDFVFTVDATDLEDGAYTWYLYLEHPEQEIPIQQLGGYDEFIIGDGDLSPEIAVDPADPDVGQEVTFDASASMGNISSYEWDFGDGNTTTGDKVVTHSFDEIDTYEITLTVTDENGETATTTESVSVGGHVAIRHGDWSTGRSNGVFTDNLQVLVNDPETRLDIGGDSNTAFVITNTETDKTLTVTPEGEDRVSVYSVAFSLHHGTGELHSTQNPTVSHFGPEGDETMAVDLEGDLDIFESNSTFSTYEITMIDTEHDHPIETTGERLMGIGYEAELAQNSTDGEIEVTIPRDAEVDESWNVTFELFDSSTGPIEVANTAGAEYFEFTIDASELEDGEHSWNLVLEKPDQETNIQRLRVNAERSDGGLVVDTGSDIAIEPAFYVSDTTPTVGDTVTFDASEAIAVDGDEEIEFDDYHWDFGDGTTITTDDLVIEHTFGAAGEYNVTATFSAGGETETYTQTVTASEPLEPAFFAVDDLDPVEGTFEQPENLTVSATVTNTGDEEETKEVTLQLDDTVLGTQSVTLGAEESDTVVFDGIDTAELEPGAYTHGVYTADDNQTGALTIEEPPEAAFFAVDDLDPVDDTVVHGDDLTVSATVTNTGDETETQSVELRVDGEVHKTESVTLDGDDSDTVTFTVDTNEFDPGVYTHGVYTDDDNQTGTVTIEEPPEPAFFAVSNLEPGDVTLEQGENLTASATVINTGDEGATKVVELHLDGDVLATETLSLEADESTTVLFEELDTTALEPGEYAYGVSTENDTQTSTVTVEEPPEPAFFTVTDLEPVDETVVNGDALTVSATVTNTGDETETQPVELRVGGEVHKTESVTLDGGDSDTVTFTFETSDLEPGTYTHGVYTDDDEQTGTLTIEEPPEPAFFAVDDLDPVDHKVVHGDDLTVSAEVTNTGDEEAEQEVEFTVDGTVLETESVTLDGGDSQTVTFTLDTSEFDVGSYTYGVYTADDEQTTSLAVKEPATFAVEIDEAAITEEIGQGDELAVVVTVENLGEVSATQPVALEFGADGTVASEEVTLEGSESEQITLTYEIPADTPPEETTLTVSSDDDVDETTIEVHSTEEYVIDTVTASPVTAGDELTIDVEVENVGNGTAEQPLTLSVGGENQTVTVALDPGATETYPFTHATTAADVPGLSVTAQVDEHEVTETARVRTADPATFTINDLSLPTDVTQGETVTADVTITNDGDLEGTDDVALLIASEKVVTESIDLEGGDTTTVTLEYELPHEPRAGIHDVDVAVTTTDDVAFDTLAVDYETIESGIEVADQGDTVEVAGGDYTESVVVETANVTILGIDGSDATTITPDGEVGFSVEAQDVTISRLSIDGAGTETGILATANNSEIVRNAFTNLEIGVHLDDSDEHTIEHNTFEESVQTLVRFTASDDNVIEGNTASDAIDDSDEGDAFGIMATAAGSANDGIVFADGSDGTVIRQNSLDVGGDAIVLEASAGGDNTAIANNLEGDNLSVANHLNPTTFTGDANYYGGDLEDRTVGEVEDTPVEERYTEATYLVSIVETPEAVTVGEELAVTVTVENTGDYEGRQDLALMLDGTVIATEHDVQVAEAGSESFTLTTATADSLVGSDRSLAIASDDDTDTDLVTVHATPLFDVLELTAPAEVDQGSELQVTTTVENLGGEATQELELRLGTDVSDADAYTVLDTESVTLAEDETTVSFDVTVPEDATGMTVLAVASDDGTLETIIDVREVEDDEESEDEESGGGSAPPPMPAPTPAEPAHFELAAIDLPTTVDAGETMTVLVPVTNVGEEAGTTTVTLHLGDEVIAEETIDLEADADTTATFEVSAPETVGDVTLDVQTADDTETAVFTVEDDEPAETDEPEETDDDTQDADEPSETDDEAAVDDEPADADDDTSETDDTDDADDAIDADDTDDAADDGLPGFGSAVAIVAVLGVALMLARRP
ncbi:CARDB domain-containing protein [Natrialbaceae archaeon A-CW1-1]